LIIKKYTTTPNKSLQKVMMKVMEPMTTGTIYLLISKIISHK